MCIRKNSNWSFKTKKKLMFILTEISHHTMTYILYPVKSRTIARRISVNLAKKKGKKEVFLTIYARK